MKASWLVAGALGLALGLANGCGTGATACKVDPDCSAGGVCYGGYCVDPATLASINGGGGNDAEATDMDSADGGAADAGADADAGALNNGRDGG